MDSYLVVGGSAVSGQQAIAAIRNRNPSARIISTTTGTDSVARADETLTGIDLVAGGVESIIESVSDPVTAIVYIPARGMVGKPVQYYDRSEYEDSIAFSVIPALKLTKALQPARLIWLSGFMWLSSLRQIYGTMTYTKISMEELTFQYPDLIRCIRLGTFVSRSTRGISVLLQKTLQSGKYPELESLKNSWKESGKKFKDYFNELALITEEKELGHQYNFKEPYRPLSEDDIRNAFEMALFE